MLLMLLICRDDAAFAAGATPLRAAFFATKDISPR